MTSTCPLFARNATKCYLLLCDDTHNPTRLCEPLHFWKCTGKSAMRGGAPYRYADLCIFLARVLSLCISQEASQRHRIQNALSPMLDPIGTSFSRPCRCHFNYDVRRHGFAFSARYVITSLLFLSRFSRSLLSCRTTALQTEVRSFPTYAYGLCTDLV